jgi:hypothetical protein
MVTFESEQDIAKFGVRMSEGVNTTALADHPDEYPNRGQAQGAPRRELKGILDGKELKGVFDGKRSFEVGCSLVACFENTDSRQF